MDDEIAELERKWKHASEVAFASIGQPDRYENVKYREQLAVQLCKARAKADRQPVWLTTWTRTKHDHVRALRQSDYCAW